MRQYDQNNVVTARALVIKSSFGKPGDRDGGASSLRAKFLGGGSVIAYLKDRFAQKQKINASLSDLTKVRNNHDKVSKAEITRLDKKIQKDPQDEKFKELKTAVITSRISAAKDAVDQALAKKIAADKNQVSCEKKVSDLTVAMSEKLDAIAKGFSVISDNSSEISSQVANDGSSHSKGLDASKTQDKSKTLQQLASDLNEAKNQLRLAKHAVKAAEKRLKSEDATHKYWSGGGLAMRALADATNNIKEITASIVQKTTSVEAPIEFMQVEARAEDSTDKSAVLRPKNNTENDFFLPT